MSESPKRGRGRPPGTPGGGRYGCRTKVVRVPFHVANNIDTILASFEDIKILVDSWEDSISEKSSPRYERAKQLLHELRSCLGE